jgi:hypothetical protein
VKTAPDIERRGTRATLVTALRVIFLMVCLGLLTLPAVNMVVPIFAQAPLSGVLPDTPLPQPSLASLASEKLQSGFTAYFEQHYGVRPWATRLDNSLAYWVFGEQPPDKMARVGTNGVLYINDQVYFYNREDKPDGAAMATKVKRAQDLLLARGKVFVLMIMPTKATIWPDEVPWAWRREGAVAREAESHITDPFVKALQSVGAMYVDGRKSVASLPPEAVYAKTGRHLTGPATCQIFRDALDIARPLVHDAEVPEIECNFRMSKEVPIIEEDFDLLRLLNIWTPPPTNAVPAMEPTIDRVPRERRANAMVLGTSFGWKVVYEAERTHALRRIYYYYYESTLVDRETKTDRKVSPRSKDWQDLIADSTLFFYPAPEEYLLQDGEAFYNSVIATYGDNGDTPPDVVKKR